MDSSSPHSLASDTFVGALDTPYHSLVESLHAFGGTENFRASTVVAGTVRFEFVVVPYSRSAKCICKCGESSSSIRPHGGEVVRTAQRPALNCGQRTAK